MDNFYNHIVLNFDKAQTPRFEEKKSKGYIEFGEHNDYPKYLLNLYNESPKHGAIVKSKSNYIFGKGFENNDIINSNGESWNDVLKKCIKDDELYRGYYLQIIWNRIKQVSEIYHIEFHKVRVSKDIKKFFVKNDWSDYKEKSREYEAFNILNPYGSQILYVKEYNPSSEVYPLPIYFQGLNYIESDIEVSRHILGMARKSFVGSTLINLNNGDPINEEHKAEIERGIIKNFTGDSGKRVVIMYNKSKDNQAEIIPLATSTLTKEDFTNVNNLIQQEIFASHQIVSPTLFGIKTEGQLGARNEIRDAYEIFNNVYVSERQKNFEIVFNKLNKLKGGVDELKISPVEPLKFEFTENIMSMNLTKDEIRALMGKEPLDTSIKTQSQIISDNINALSPLVANKVLESMTPDEIRGLAGLVSPQINNNNSPTQEVKTPMISNDAIRNLTGRQYQNVMRIVRQFSQGKLSKAQASLMLKSGFNFTDDDVNTFLGIDESPITDFEIQKFSMNEEDFIISEFEKFGEDVSGFEVVNTKSLSELEYKFNVQLNQAEANVLDLMTKDENITPEVIATTLKISVKDVIDIIKSLVNYEVIKVIPSKINTLPKYEVLQPVSEVEGKNPKTAQLLIRYSYEWRVPPSQQNYATSRPFCKRMMDLSKIKVWSRADIETISARLGYSVFERVGGWWTMPNGEHSIQCRHEWKSKLVKKKQ